MIEPVPENVDLLHLRNQVSTISYSSFHLALDTVGKVVSADI